MSETMSSRGGGGNSTSRSMNASSARGGGGGRPTSAPAPQRTSNSAIRQRVAEKKKLVEAQFLGRESNVTPQDLPPFWSTSIHGVPYNEGDPLDIARGAMTARGACASCVARHPRACEASVASHLSRGLYRPSKHTQNPLSPHARFFAFPKLFWQFVDQSRKVPIFSHSLSLSLIFSQTFQHRQRQRAGAAA